VIKQAFREDLYYRLNIATIYIPPLRERKEDIALLTDYFVKEYCKALNRPHVEIDSEAMQELNTYDYPGNIREMENLIERAILLCDNNKITHCDLPFGKNYQKNDFDSLREVEKKHILKVLEANQWNISLSARILEVDRVTLYSKINKHGLEREVD
jgi:DNA-binding NtrC family response regulator